MSQLTHGGLSLGWFQTHLALGLWLLPGQVTVATQLEGWPAELGAAIAWAWILAAFAYSWPQIRTTILPWLAAPAVITVAYSLLAHKLLYADRYYLLFVYALAAWTGVAISRLLRRSPRRAALAMIGAVALASVGCAYAVNPSFYTADWEHVAAVLRARSNPTDLLVFEEGSGHWAFRYYEGRPRHSALLVSSPGQIDDAMRIVDTRRRVWLIGSMIRGLDPNLRLLHHLERCCRLAYFEESTRLLPSEDVEIGLFVRK